YTLPVVLGNPSDITQWKRRRAGAFLQNIEFSDEEKTILATLKDFSALDFATVSHAVGGKIEEVSKALTRLVDYHVIESVSDTFLVAPPMRDAVDRDQRFTLTPDRHKRMLSSISEELTAPNENTAVSMSMVEAGILATLQGGKELPSFFPSFLLPSHLVWLARRRYDNKNNVEAIRLARSALEGRQRLSPAGKVEACRILCLAAARRAQEDDFRFGIQILQAVPQQPWVRSSLNFLLGFNARMRGNLPKAEEYFRLAYGDSPRNFSAA